MAGKYRNLYYALNRYIFSVLPDAFYHNLLGWIMHKRAGVKYHWMNIKEPRTFSEKLQWLKSHGDIQLKSRLADKYDVRDWVVGRIGDDHLAHILPLNKNGDLYVTDVDKIDWESLPEQFALKLTKGSGYNIICKNKSLLDKERTLRKLKEWLKVENYYLSREPQYKGQNKIICEQLLEYNIRDYKFFCFDGEPKFLKVDVDRFGDHHANYYDMDWNLLELNEILCSRNPNIIIEKPQQFDKMLSIVRKLAAGFKFVRVDLYEHAGQIFFGEMTFIPAGGYTPLLPREWEYKIGDTLQL